ncbi:MAG: hypothetical protein PW789_06935 [Edaphobacter sp.]|uniref:hypothetical protein n=1 Tax=Edaphobacter sp. TaxID=1934404 RepID=UPI0023978F68|nr:hypothetical protein [Edaphobacter sp.]MDE1176329.1 hypothetical protein [Edaphobacter sp.]
MRFLRPRLRSLMLLPAMLCLCSAGSWGVVSTSWQQPEVRRVVPGKMTLGKMALSRAHRRVHRGDGDISESLREDVARHPKDFVIFPSRMAAGHFLREHVSETTRETEPRMIRSGVVGYWQGKTVVVVPTISSMLDADDPSRDRN